MDKFDHWLGKLFGSFNGDPKYAVTFGQTTYFSVPEREVAIWWHVHEDTHKKQYTKDGWFKFLRRYIWQLITKGYLNIDYEIEARTNASKFGGQL
jgi:hypothetical protein